MGEKFDYKNIIYKSIEGIYQTGVATKILEHMSRIRNISNRTQSRRWIMELLQNSRDTAYDNQGVRIKVELDNDVIKYSHNGRPFRVKDILSVVNQVSSKVDEDDKIGKFGTGFVTTYQLSEVVEIESLLQDKFVCPNGDIVNLPCKPFRIRLDRRGRTSEEILRSIDESLRELEIVDQVSPLEAFDKNQFNTTFTYHLDNNESREIAKIGMEDLEDNIYFILAFSKKIKSVELVDNTGYQKRFVKYSVEGSKTGEFYTHVKVNKTTNMNSEPEVHKVMIMSDGDVSIAVMKKGDRLEKISDKTPRLFIDFPLLGAEKFPFPVVINSSLLQPNEPRSGIALSDKENSSDSVINKKIIERACNLYALLLPKCVEQNIRNIENIIQIPFWEENPEISSKWVKKNVYECLFNIIEKQRIINTMVGKLSLNDERILIAASESEEEREGIYDLISKTGAYICPDDKTDWYHFLNGYECEEKATHRKFYSLNNIVDIAGALMKKVALDKKYNPTKWCNLLYQLCWKNELIRKDIFAGEIAIFPNQNMDDIVAGRLFKITQLYRDNTPDDVLKEIAEAFSDVKRDLHYSVRLINRDIELDTSYFARVIDEESIALEINNVVSWILKSMRLKDDTENHQLACTKLLAWIRNHMDENENLAKRYFPAFYHEDDQIQLMTANAMTDMYQKAKAIETLLDEFDCNNSEELLELIKTGRDIDSDKSHGDTQCFFDESDFYFDSGLQDEFDSNESFNEFCKYVGKFGEKKAFDYLRKSVLEEGYMETEETTSSSDVDRLLFEKYVDGRCEKIEIFYPDANSGFCQPGWDIRMTHFVDDIPEAPYYFEVKTHTEKSIVRNYVNISPEQLSCALENRERYSVLMVSYHRGDEESSSVSRLCNLEQLIASKKIGHCVNKYTFRI